MQLPNNFILKKDDIVLSIIDENDQVALESISQDSRIWAHNPHFNDPKQFPDEWFKKALQQKEKGTRIPFVIRYKNQVIGSTSFYDMDDHKVTIGYTWLHPDYWGRGINGVIKQMLLHYLFTCEKLGEVNFVIDILNLRSRAAVEKLGAIQTDTIYNHIQRPDGSWRASIVYSITPHSPEAI
ncbi:MAG: GNAT family protein [Legionellales bacterium]